MAIRLRIAPKRAHSLKKTMDQPTHDTQTVENNEFDRGDTQDTRSSPIRADAVGEDEAIQLKGLATEVRDQDDLERDIGRQVRSLSLPPRFLVRGLMSFSRPINY